MGRRSINTTKSGKYMNPTDQARKEARKKELKKNKRQRQMVRAAVLKMKDPSQILEELQKIDEMEYNVIQPSPLNEKVLKEKRKKLRETFDRVLKMYDKDEPEKWVELKRQDMEYEKKRAHLISYYESVKHAQSVQLEDIPLPALQVPENILYGNLPSQIPMPADPGHAKVLKPILKKDSVIKERPSGIEPPGVPPGPPPDFAELLAESAKTHAPKKLRFSAPHPQPGPTAPTTHPAPTPVSAAPIVSAGNAANVDITPFIPNEIYAEVQPPGDHAPVPQPIMASMPPHLIENFDGEPMEQDGDGSQSGPNAPKPTSLQQRMLALSGQNIDEFMKEMEEVHKKRERDRAADLNARLSALKRKDRRDSDSDSEGEGPPAPPPLLLPNMSIEPPGTVPPPPPGIRPPPLRPPLGPPPMRMPGLPLGMPPGPPLGLPPGPPLGLPLRPHAPPGPPPGLPPRMLRPPGPPPGAPPRLLRPIGPPMVVKLAPPVSVLTAAPQLIQKKEGQTGATITAKPQIRNLSADVTRFVPSALRVKREDKKAKAPQKSTVQRAADVPKQAPTKDDAYMQFMREMEGLL